MKYNRTDHVVSSECCEEKMVPTLEQILSPRPIFEIDQTYQIFCGGIIVEWGDRVIKRLG